MLPSPGNEIKSLKPWVLQDIIITKLARCAQSHTNPRDLSSLPVHGNKAWSWSPTPFCIAYPPGCLLSISPPHLNLQACKPTVPQLATTYLVTDSFPLLRMFDLLHFNNVHTCILLYKYVIIVQYLPKRSLYIGSRSHLLKISTESRMAHTSHLHPSVKCPCSWFNMSAWIDQARLTLNL